MQLINVTVICLLFLYVVALLVFRVTRVNNIPLWGDGFTYVRTAKQIAKIHRLPKELDFYLVSKEKGDLFTLPPLLMLLLVPFHRLNYRTISWIPYLVDLLIAVVISAMVHTLMNATLLQAVTASLIYLLSPINAFVQTQITPRPLGALFFLLFVAFFSIFMKNGSTQCLLFCPLWIALLLLSQRMVTQILVLGIPFIAIFLMICVDYRIAMHFLAVVASGVLLAVVMTGGYYRTVFIDHYRRIIQHARHGDQTTFRKKLGNPLQIVKANPWMVVLGFLMLVHGAPDLYVAPIAGYLIISMMLAFFWVFGNSVNHVYFASPLGALLISKYLFLNLFETIILLATATGCLYLIYREYSVAVKKQIDRQWFECFSFIRDREMKGAILVLPGIACPPIVYYTNLRLISAGHGSKAMEFNRLFLRENISNPAFIKKFVTENGVAWVLFEKSRLRLDVALILKDVYPTIFENEALCLLKMTG